MSRLLSNANILNSDVNIILSNVDHFSMLTCWSKMLNISVLALCLWQVASPSKAYASIATYDSTETFSESCSNMIYLHVIKIIHHKKQMKRSCKQKNRLLKHCLSFIVCLASVRWKDGVFRDHQVKHPSTHLQLFTPSLWDSNISSREIQKGSR